MTKIFLLGSHRTGTKTFGGFFQEYFEDMTSFHQYDLLRWVNIWSNMYVSGKMPASMFHWLLQKRWIKAINQYDTKWYVESNGFNYIAADYAKTVFPKVKIIHIIRDPRDFVTSYYNWVKRPTKANKVKQNLPYWNVPGDQVNAFSRQEWRQMDDFQRYCWYWTYKNEKIEEIYKRDNTNYHLLKFEDIIHAEKRAETLQACLEYLELPYHSEQLQYFDRKQNQSKEGLLTKWRKWSPEQKQQLEGYCGDLMRKYGYSWN